jgi:hypothetical protein
MLTQVLVASLAPLLFSQPTSATSLTTWLKNPPNTNSSLVDEIQCYSLPYGGIGFASHIITYYTIAMLALSRHPYAPWIRNKHSKLDIILAVIGLIITILISTLTMIRCRSRWQFIAIAAWKLDISVVLGCLSVHAAVILPKGEIDWEYYQIDPRDARKVLFWLLLYIPGVVGGLAGLFSLVGETIKTNQNVKTITGVFGGVTLLVALLVGLLVWLRISERGSSEGSLDPVFASGMMFLGVTIGCLAILGAFYSDWILAAIAENLSGFPSSDNAALYWSYFVAKRLPFFSS